jgi:hypothetical protein
MRNTIVRGSISPTKYTGNETLINQLAQMFEISGVHSVQRIFDLVADADTHDHVVSTIPGHTLCAVPGFRLNG